MALPSSETLAGFSPKWVILDEIAPIDSAIWTSRVFGTGATSGKSDFEELMLQEIAASADRAQTKRNTEGSTYSWDKPTAIEHVSAKVKGLPEPFSADKTEKRVMAIVEARLNVFAKLMAKEMAEELHAQLTRKERIWQEMLANTVSNLTAQVADLEQRLEVAIHINNENYGKF